MTLQVDVNQIALAPREQAAWAGLTIAERARRLRAYCCHAGAWMAWGSRVSGLHSKNGFPNTKSNALRGGFVQVPDAQAHEVKIDAGTLPPGRYAVTVYQDVNGNKKLDKNFLGIPQEPAGASNNPKTRMGPPSFDDCAFQFGTTDQTISIVLRRD